MQTEITLNELADLPDKTYILADIRDEISYTYGTIPGAVNYPDILKCASEGALPEDKTLILFCMHGQQSEPLADALSELGYDARSLDGGYGA